MRTLWLLYFLSVLFIIIVVSRQPNNNANVLNRRCNAQLVKNIETKRNKGISHLAKWHLEIPSCEQLTFRQQDAGNLSAPIQMQKLYALGVKLSYSLRSATRSNKNTQDSVNHPTDQNSLSVFSYISLKSLTLDGKKGILLKKTHTEKKHGCNDICTDNRNIMNATANATRKLGQWAPMIWDRKRWHPTTKQYWSPPLISPTKMLQPHISLRRLHLRKISKQLAHRHPQSLPFVVDVLRDDRLLNSCVHEISLPTPTSRHSHVTMLSRSADTISFRGHLRIH